MANALNVTSIRIFERPADRSLTIAAGFSTTQDLTAQASKPNHAAQIVEVHNAGDSAQNAVATSYDGVTLTVSLAVDERYRFRTPIKSLSATSGDDVSAVAYWWKVPGSKDNPAS